MLLNYISSTLGKLSIFIILLIIPFISYSHDFHISNPERAFSLFDEVIAYEKLQKEENYDYDLGANVVFLLDRIPSWIGLMDVDTDIRYGIMRMYTWLAQFETETLRKGIKQYLYNDPYAQEINKEKMEMARRNFFDPLDIKKEAKIYALLRVIFNVPDKLRTTGEEIPSFNFMWHGFGSYGNSPINNPGNLLWPLYIDNDGNLKLTGDYAFSGSHDYDYRETLLLSFDYLNEKYGRRNIEPMELEYKQHN